MANTTGIKFGGREAGTPNKITKDLRQKFSMLLENNIDKLQSDLDELEPKDRLKMMMEISRFVIPTLKATEIKDFSNDRFEPIIISFHE